jgi:cytochrome P450
VTATDPSTADPSIVGTADVEPFERYEEVRALGPVVWSDEMGAWLVTSYDACRYVLDGDEEFIRHADQASQTMAREYSDRSLKFLRGEDHFEMHQWWLRAFSPKKVATWRQPLVMPIVDQAFDAIVPSGRGELFADIASRIPVRVIAAVMGLPWRDDDWITTCKALLRVLLGPVDRRFAVDERLQSSAAEASDQLRTILTPIIRERRHTPADDMISALWRDGPSLFDDWSEEDVFAHVLNMFVGGTDTTSMGISSALYVLLTSDTVREQLHDGASVPAYVEEAVRLFSPVQFRHRLMTKDMEIAGQKLKENDSIVPVLAAANRDPQHYRCPAGVELDRRAARDHLAFNYGPRVCVGAALARLEIDEVVRQLLDRMPDVALDPDADPPAISGFVLRSYGPLHVTFTSSQPRA